MTTNKLGRFRHIAVSPLAELMAATAPAAAVHPMLEHGQPVGAAAMAAVTAAMFVHATVRFDAGNTALEIPDKPED